MSDGEHDSWTAHRRLVVDTLKRLEAELDRVFEKLDKIQDEDRARMERQADRIVELEKENAVSKARVALIFGLVGAAIGILGGLIPRLLGA